ncbi:hypothetical protein S245_053126 [Arachis hypogaea]
MGVKKCIEKCLSGGETDDLFVTVMWLVKSKGEIGSVVALNDAARRSLLSLRKLHVSPINLCNPFSLLLQSFSENSVKPRKERTFGWILGLYSYRCGVESYRR